MESNNKKKNEKLGMNAGTAASRLRKAIMYDLVKQLDKHYCYRCGKEIINLEEFSIEHKEPWLNSEDPRKLFFDLSNIAFSHYLCNIKSAKKRKIPVEEYKHGTSGTYSYRKCRCEKCKEYKKLSTRLRREKKRKTMGATGMLPTFGIFLA